MSMNMTIGGDSGKTWACLRAPVFTDGLVFNGDPYSGNWPVYLSTNWNQGHSAGYPSGCTELLKAFPFSWSYAGLDEWSPYGNTPIGLCSKSEYYEGGGFDVFIYLAFGNGRTYGMTNPATNSVFIGNKFDYNSVRSRLLGATVNVTYFLINGQEYTTDVVITEDMFPSDHTPQGAIFPQGEGTLITSFFVPADGPYNGLASWTVNSVNLLP